MMEKEHPMKVADHTAFLGALDGAERLVTPKLDQGIQQSSSFGERVLLVEDDFFLAFDLQEEFLLRGAEVIGPVGNLERAFSLARSDLRIDAAAIDINLNGEFAFHLVDELVARDIPVVFTTGYDANVVPYRLRHIPRYLKPIPAREVVDGIVELVAQQRSRQE
jgi:ActR/RegA family two-component response regulator